MFDSVLNTGEVLGCLKHRLYNYLDSAIMEIFIYVRLLGNLKLMNLFTGYLWKIRIFIGLTMSVRSVPNMLVPK